MSFADEAPAPAKKCTCSAKCMKECKTKKGSKNCKCEACDCAKTGACGKGEAGCAGHAEEHHEDKH